VNYTLRLFLSYTIALPVIISWIRFKQINSAYYPFIFCLWIGLLNEIISRFFSGYNNSNAVNSNIYYLLEAFFLTWQFYRWKLFDRLKIFFSIMLCLFAITWVVENFILFSITKFNSYFAITYYFAIVFMSIAMFNMLLVRERKLLLTNPIFLICSCFIIYYTYSILVEAFWVYGLNSSKEFRISVYQILLFINVFAYLVYSFAIIWMRTKQRFTLPS
jgi:hypothetical protein